MQSLLCDNCLVDKRLSLKEDLIKGRVKVKEFNYVCRKLVFNLQSVTCKISLVVEMKKQHVSFGKW